EPDNRGGSEEARNQGVRRYPGYAEGDSEGGRHHPDPRMEIHPEPGRKIVPDNGFARELADQAISKGVNKEAQARNPRNSAHLARFNHPYAEAGLGRHGRSVGPTGWRRHPASSPAIPGPAPGTC